jgi:mono/diheme cytochrome c family protein
MRRPTAAAALASLALVAVSAGCIDGKSTSAVPETVVGTVATTPSPEASLPALKLKGDATAGKAVFTGSAGCTGCHTLKDANATGTVGPNLDDRKPAFELVVTRVALGKGVMPAFSQAKGGALTDQQIADVAQYVSTVAGH